MKLRWLVLACVMGAWACVDSKPVEPIPLPEPRQRGETCMARNECAEGLVCVAGVCSQRDFDILPTAKHCDTVECGDDSDCCGDRPLEPEARCKNRDSICNTYRLPQCTENSACTSDEACGGGRCFGRCRRTGRACNDERRCAANECMDGTCSLGGGACVTSEECPTNACGDLSCRCDNPLYDTDDPVCAETGCEAACNLRCRGEQCVVMNECEEDRDCLIHGRLNHCVDGTCVDCTEDEHCLGSGQVCRSGVCEVSCVANEQCPLFHACSDGECVETGCKSDRECVLALSGDDDEIESRLALCLPASEGAALKTCRVPCDNDAECSHEFEGCLDGFCTFVGCESHEECRAYFGLEDQTITPFRPYLTTAVCRE